MNTRNRYFLSVAGIILVCILSVIPISASQSSSDEASIREALRILRDRFNTKDHLSLVGDVGPLLPTKVVLHFPGLDSLSQVVSLSEQGEVAVWDTLQQISQTEVQSAVPDTGMGLPLEQVIPTGLDTLQSLPITSSGEPTIPGVSTVPEAQLPPLSPCFRQDITTSQEDDPLDQRKKMAQGLVDLFWDIPPEVDLVLSPKSISVEGDQATVVASYGFSSLPTPRGERYRNLSGTVTLSLKRTSQGWRVTKVGEFIQTIQQAVK